MTKQKLIKICASNETWQCDLLSGTPTHQANMKALMRHGFFSWWNISKDLYNKQYVNWKKISVGGFPQWIVDRWSIRMLKVEVPENFVNMEHFMKTECFELPEQIMIPVCGQDNKGIQKISKGPLSLSKAQHGLKTQRIWLLWDSIPTQMLNWSVTPPWPKTLFKAIMRSVQQRKAAAFKDLASSTQDRLIVFYNQCKWKHWSGIAAELENRFQVNGQNKDL